MARNDYRVGRKTATVVLPLALHGQMKRAAADAGLSMQEWLVEAAREKVSRDGRGGVGPRSGRDAVAGGGGPGLAAPSGGEADAGVGVGDVAGPLTEGYVLPESAAGPWPVPSAEYEVGRWAYDEALAIDPEAAARVAENMGRSLAAEWDEMVAHG